jgi:hypothetical protein
VAACTFVIGGADGAEACTRGAVLT